MAMKKTKAKTVRTATKSKKVVTKSKGRANVNVKVNKSAPKKSTVVKKSVAKGSKKEVVAKKKKSSDTIREKQSRTDILKNIADSTQLTKVQVENVFDELKNIMAGHLKKKGSGEFTIPKTGVKILRVKKKASKARLMVSPLTGKEVTIAAKPARNGVKITALKSLKEMVEK